MTHSKFRRLTDDFWVAPQLEAEDFEEIAKLGIRTVINNRPDGEEPGQLTDAEARQAAREAGLAYVFVPVVSGCIFPDHIEAMGRVLDTTEGPWLAYCRSGTRCCNLWALLAARAIPPARIVELAARAGYDLQPVWGVLEQIHARDRELAASP